ncbi:hypothetical protein ABPG72_003080 [Tetrahymena utriculariae]
MKLIDLQENESSPSIISNQRKQVLRQEMVKCMLQAASHLKISPKTLGKALYLVTAFDKIYGKHFDQTLCCMSAIYLASKLDDNQLEVDNCIKQYTLLSHNQRKYHRKLSFDQLETDGDQLEILKMSLFEMETELLLSIGFNLKIRVPQEYLELYLKKLSKYIEKPIFEAANTILNDSYQLNVCITHRPDHIAIACLYISMSLFKKADLQINSKCWIDYILVVNDQFPLHLFKKLLSQISSIYDSVSAII